MLAHNLRHWPIIKPALVQRLVFAGLRSTQYTQNIIFCVLCGVFWNVMFWKSKKLQVRDYLFKWTEFFRIRYVRSWVVGLPNHPQLQNYMTFSIKILFTLLWFFASGWLNKRWPYVVLMLDQCRRQWPAWSINMLWQLPSLYPANTRRWNNIGLIESQRGWQWTNVSQH